MPPNLTIAFSGALAPALRDLFPRYEQQTGASLALVRGPSIGASPEALPNRLSRGEPIDVLIMAGDALADLAAQGLVLDRIDLATVGIALAVRAGTPVPDISTTEALRQTLLAAPSIGTSVSASGVYVRDTLMARLGIVDETRDVIRVITGEPVGRAVARGDIALGFQQFSELLPIDGITIAGPLPPDVQQHTVFSAGLAAASPHQTAARAFLAFLRTPDAAAVIAASGMTPIGA